MLKKFSLLPLSVFSELFGVVVLDDELTAAYKTEPIKWLCMCMYRCVCVCVMHKTEGWVCAQLPIPYKWVKLKTLLLTLSLFCLCISSSYAHKQIIKRTHKRNAHNYSGVRMFLLVFSFSKFLPGLRLQIVGIWTETLSPLRWAYFSDWQTLWGSCCTCCLLRWLLNLGTVEFI